MSAWLWRGSEDGQPGHIEVIHLLTKLAIEDYSISEIYASNAYLRIEG